MGDDKFIDHCGRKSPGEKYLGRSSLGWKDNTKMGFGRNGCESVGLDSFGSEYDPISALVSIHTP